MLAHLLGNVYLHYAPDRWFERRVKPLLRGRTTFDLLGFTFYWARTKARRWAMFFKTRNENPRWIIRSIDDWCHHHRHHSVEEQHEALTRRIQGHFNCFGVSGRFRSLQLVLEQVNRTWFN